MKPVFYYLIACSILDFLSIFACITSIGESRDPHSTGDACTQVIVFMMSAFFTYLAWRALK